MKLTVGLVLGAVALTAHAESARVRPFQPKVKDVFTVLVPGAIKPQGWMRDRALAAMRGLSGDLDSVHRDFRIAWGRGFRPASEKMSWEAGAWSFEGGGYWFDGLIRLAAQLDDRTRIQYVTERLTPVLDDVRPDSVSLLAWMNRSDDATVRVLQDNRNNFPLSKCGMLARALDAYWDVTRDPRVPRVMAHAFDDIRYLRAGYPLHNIVAAFDAWRMTGDSKTAAALDECFRDISVIASAGKRYAGKPDTANAMMEWRPTKDWSVQHGVVCHESMVAWLRAYQWTGNVEFRDNLFAWLDFLRENATQPHGATVAGEAWGYAGAERATETCAVVASLWLRLQLLAAFGDAKWADEAERILFNAAPQCVSRDYRAHVYHQTPNRVHPHKPDYACQCDTPIAPFRYERKHYPLCCTANLTRMIPCAIQYKWLTDDDGIVAAIYGPDETELNWNGKTLRLRTETSYPFDEKIVVHLGLDEAEAHFTVKLRLPCWCENPQIRINDESAAYPVCNGFAAIRRNWRNGDCIELVLPMKPTLERGVDRNVNRPYSVVRLGPLTMCAPLREFDENTPERNQSADWKLDPKTALDDVKIIRTPLKPGFDWPLDAPVKLEVNSSRGRLALVPYGCAKFRIAMFGEAHGFSWGQTNNLQ